MTQQHIHHMQHTRPIDDTQSSIHVEYIDGMRALCTVVAIQ